MYNRSNETMWAGALIRGKIRGALDALKMYGHIQDYKEAKGFWESTFYIKGADSTAKGNISTWHKQLGEE